MFESKSRVKSGLEGQILSLEEKSVHGLHFKNKSYILERYLIDYTTELRVHRGLLIDGWI